MEGEETEGSGWVEVGQYGAERGQIPKPGGLLWSPHQPALVMKGESIVVPKAGDGERGAEEGARWMILGRRYSKS